jgi:hypothetical protein
LAEAKRRMEVKKQQLAEAAQLRGERRMWGGCLPSERMLRLRDKALHLARMDRPLIDWLDRADDATLRAIARWVTRRVYVEAQLADVDWIAPALAAMDRGEPLPPPFDDDIRALDRAMSDPLLPQTGVVPDEGGAEFSQQAMAFPVIFSVNEPDPLLAALDTISSAAAGFGFARRHVLFAELRQSFSSVQ